MIKLLNENTPFPSTDDGVFSLRQRAFFNAYGVNQKFFSVWHQTDKNENVTSVITSLSGDITLALTDKSDFEEINEFLRAVGSSSIFFNKKYSDYFSFGNKTSGKIMKLKNELPKTDFTFTEPDYKAVFNLLFENNEVSFPDWFTDVSHRIRHDTALADTYILDGRTVACAFCQAKANNKALIGSVKTDEKYRKKGIGSLIVTRLCSYLQQNGFEVYLCREENKNEKFYNRIGFADCGEWTNIKNE